MDTSVPRSSPNRYAAATPSVHDIPSLFFAGRYYLQKSKTIIIILFWRMYVKQNYLLSAACSCRYLRNSRIYSSAILLRIIFFFTIYPISIRLPAICSSAMKGTAI